LVSIGPAGLTGALSFLFLSAPDEQALKENRQMAEIKTALYTNLINKYSTR
jgi:hypothetical protein